MVEDLSGVTVDDEDLFGVNYRLRKAQKLKLKQQVIIVFTFHKVLGRDARLDFFAGSQNFPRIRILPWLLKVVLTSAKSNIFVIFQFLILWFLIFFK